MYAISHRRRFTTSQRDRTVLNSHFSSLHSRKTARVLWILVVTRMSLTPGTAEQARQRRNTEDAFHDGRRGAALFPSCRCASWIITISAKNRKEYIGFWERRISHIARASTPTLSRREDKMSKKFANAARKIQSAKVVSARALDFGYRDVTRQQRRDIKLVYVAKVEEK